ncbi:MAG: hypothetical protein K0R57_5087 [Paenibacillaceae bacterium]|jgi:DNA-binding PadR family transcriptional regulator|nr:hypothetical protein [Paenibacillaceae bacterium]
MSINHAILGILSCGPLTGYDLKKIIQDSTFMHWSGNNNQIYKSLVELLDQGFVTHEILHQESSPSKKIYTITPQGEAELKDWVLSAPEAPEFKKTFLVQLAWADRLDSRELHALLSRYECEIGTQLILQQEAQRRGRFSPARTSREERIWELISENISSTLRNELEWARKMRTELCGEDEEGQRMKIEVIEANGRHYMECASAVAPVQTEQDALDLIGTCMGNDVNLLLLHDEVLSDDFFQLRTGLAGNMVQKFINYRIKLAVVAGDTQRMKGKFKEFLAETNKGGSFRIFNSRDEAVEWLLQ